MAVSTRCSKALAERAGLSALIDQRVHLVASARVKSAGSNPVGKVTSIIAGMSAGADIIDDLDVLRAGGMSRLFGAVYAPATLGQFLREFPPRASLSSGRCPQARP